MIKRAIILACVLFMLAAVLAVSAQENTVALNNASMNNTTLSNNTTQNATTSEPIIVVANENVIEAPIEIIPAQNETLLAPIEVIAAQNETVPAQETNLSENATATVEEIAVVEETIAGPVLQPGAMQIGSPQRTVFAIGGIGTSPNLFSIDGKALAQGAYEVGLPAKTIMDLSALPFFLNKI